MHAFDVSTVICVGYRGRILKTINGGTNWNVINSTTTKNLKAISFYNSTVGMTVGDGIILRTTDGGDTCTSTISNYDFKDIYYLGELDLLAITNLGTVLRSKVRGEQSVWYSVWCRYIEN